MNDECIVKKIHHLHLLAPSVSPARLVNNTIARVGEDVSESAICQIGLLLGGTKEGAAQQQI